METKIILALLCYFISINLIGFVIMKVDKEKAKKNRWRIPEKTLFTIAFLFGSFGVHLGMRTFRHKTKHNQFVFGIPAIELLQVLMIGGGIYLTWFY